MKYIHSSQTTEITIDKDIFEVKNKDLLRWCLPIIRNDFEKIFDWKKVWGAVCEDVRLAGQVPPVALGANLAFIKIKKDFLDYLKKQTK